MFYYELLIQTQLSYFLRYICTLFDPKGANWTLNMVLFNALVVQLLPNLISNGINFLNYFAKFSPGAGTKMHK